MGKLAVEAFLETVYHCFPIVLAGVVQAAAIWHFGKVISIEQGFQSGIEIGK